MKQLWCKYKIWLQDFSSTSEIYLDIFSNILTHFGSLKYWPPFWMHYIVKFIDDAPKEFFHYEKKHFSGFILIITALTVSEWNLSTFVTIHFSRYTSMKTPLSTFSDIFPFSVEALAWGLPQPKRFYFILLQRWAVPACQGRKEQQKGCKRSNCLSWNHNGVWISLNPINSCIKHHLSRLEILVKWYKKVFHFIITFWLSHPSLLLHWCT